MQQLPDALAALASVRQFVVCKFVPRNDGTGKVDKLPIDPHTGRMPTKGGGGAHDPAIRVDAATACRLATQWGGAYGVGFVFTADDPFFFIDLDAQLQADGTWSPIAQQLCQVFAGAYVEVSQSGKGLHIIGRGTPPPHGCESDYKIGGFYHELRFCALTGFGAQGDAGKDCTHLLPWLVDSYFPLKPGAERVDELTEAPVAEWRGPIDDEDLIRRAMMSSSARAAFTGHATFADLWLGNVEALARSYPPDGNKDTPYNESQADMALAQHLAFWTGRHGTRIESLMWQSGLAREKWRERDDYVPRTILKALGLQRDVLTDKLPEERPGPPVEVDAPKPVATTGTNFLTPSQQMDLFAGCVYVVDQHRVLVPGGRLLPPDRFRVMFGGYSFLMDADNTRTVRDAFEAFTQNQAYRRPMADTMCFRPDLPPGALVTTPGCTAVNTWWPVEVPRKAGDPAPFLAHLRKLLPDERDAMLLLSYMAACVQHMGTKFQWTVILQGVEGNGKTLFTRCVAEAVGRRYVHWPKASKLAAQFNGWMPGKVFYGVEDVYTPSSKAEVLEELKPMITGGDGLEIEGKGVDQVSMDICGNFMLNTNHKAALKKTRNDRRYANLFTAQQSLDDLRRDGMLGDYFPKLYNWLKADGYAIVNELLHTWPIPRELNPAYVDRSPTTSSTDEAIAATMGPVEQEIMEQVEQGAPGFAGGWISSLMLDRLLERINRTGSVPRNQRREMLATLGYELHPGLRDGRVDNMVMPDNGKPRLFVRTGHTSLSLTNAADVARMYSAAQTAPIVAIR